MGPPKKRDEGWFTSLYRADYAHIVRYGLRRLADGDAAAELAQEVFIVAWRRRTEVPDRSLPWLYGVARRLLANQWRSRRAAPDVLPITDADLTRVGHSSSADVAVGVADVRAALTTLNDLDQEILRLIGWEELTVSEAARVLGCTRAAAAVRLHRARRRLTEAMSNQPTPRRRPALVSVREDL
ncbi:sigma-70 family RNA polymerase sigma factor [Micromonospora sp. CPCC 205539]|uniref:RNA polymerase sigma factor n=1 Tax=Micromonospora sp. CPCC 205539 TaxID=3122408 RepID=UPI002FF27306